MEKRAQSGINKTDAMTANNKDESDTSPQNLFMGEKDRRRSSAIKVFLGDYLNLTNNQTIQKLLTKYGDKKVDFADVVIKINKRNKMQDRIILISEAAIYNIDPGSYKCKRRIPLKELGSVSLSKLPDNFFTFHVPSEYDYLMVSSKKTEIVTLLMQNTEKSTGTNLKINFSNKFEYRIDQDTVREIHFNRVEGGISTRIYTKQKPRTYTK